MTRGHVSRHPPSSAAVGEYSDEYYSYRVTCGYNRLEDTCSYDRVEDTCRYNRVEDTCRYNRVGDMCRYNRVEDTCSYNRVEDTKSPVQCFQAINNVPHLQLDPLYPLYL